MWGIVYFKTPLVFPRVNQTVLDCFHACVAYLPFSLSWEVDEDDFVGFRSFDYLVRSVFGATGAKEQYVFEVV